MLVLIYYAYLIIRLIRFSCTSTIFTRFKKKMDQILCKKKTKLNAKLAMDYGEATLDRCNVYRWYRLFSKGRENVNGEEHAGARQ